MPDASPDLTSDTPPKRGRFRLRYSLRSLLRFMLLLSAALALWRDWLPWRIEHVLRGHVDAVVSAKVSPDGRHILTASYDHTARVWRRRPVCWYGVLCRPQFRRGRTGVGHPVRRTKITEALSAYSKTQAIYVSKYKRYGTLVELRDSNYIEKIVADATTQTGKGYRGFYFKEENPWTVTNKKFWYQLIAVPALKKAL